MIRHTDGPGRLGTADLAGDLTVTSCLSVRDRQKRIPYQFLKLGSLQFQRKFKSFSLSLEIFFQLARRLIGYLRPFLLLLFLRIFFRKINACHIGFLTPDFNSVSGDLINMTCEIFLSVLFFLAFFLFHVFCFSHFFYLLYFF